MYVHVILYHSHSQGIILSRIKHYAFLPILSKSVSIQKKTSNTYRNPVWESCI